MIVTGDPTVNGTTTTVNPNTVNIGDNIIVLNPDETGNSLLKTVVLKLSVVHQQTRHLYGTKLQINGQ